MKTLAIVQARMGSTRLPQKVMMPIRGVPLIEWLLRRLSRCTQLDQIVVATSTNTNNHVLVDCVEKLGFVTSRGSEDDVLDRYYQAAKQFRPDIIVRITADCPLMDPALVDELVSAFKRSSFDYLCNINPPTYPDGLDIEVFSREALEKAWTETQDVYEREHVTPYLRESGRFKTKNLPFEQDHSGERWTLDEPADFLVIEKVIEHFWPRDDFGWQEVISLRQTHPLIFVANQHLMRNEGSKK